MAAPSGHLSYNPHVHPFKTEAIELNAKTGESASATTDADAIQPYWT